uniref:Uncharacterized protein n=1 Tax=Picea glauca TaxID=3330 RepID=A0A124GNS7_PICGL|nr:hypothetical protein ABT39_MTgene2970 [Picea glauca]
MSSSFHPSILPSVRCAVSLSKLHWGIELCVFFRVRPGGTLLRLRGRGPVGPAGTHYSYGEGSSTTISTILYCIYSWSS